ncbi:hypothetical protein ES703_98733 [subsurface metagenome]
MFIAGYLTGRGTIETIVVEKPSPQHDDDYPNDDDGYPFNHQFTSTQSIGNSIWAPGRFVLSRLPYPKVQKTKIVADL